MQAFARLFEALDQSTATLEKRAALAAYFQAQPPRDAAWALYLLSGNKIGGAGRKIAASGELRTWIAEASDTPPWLVEESYQQVGDLAETIALLLPPRAEVPPAVAPRSLADWIESFLLPLANRPAEERAAAIQQAWRALDFTPRLVFSKLLTGALRVGVSQRLVQQALAEISGVPIELLAQRMLGRWEPSATFFTRLLSPDPQPGDRQQPYPFYLASPLENSVQALGEIADWQLEWKWDGIRVQVICRAGEAGVALWSRGEERLDGRFPEIEAAFAARRDAGGLFAEPLAGVFDGELLAWQPGQPEPMPFTALQTRIQRRKPGPQTLLKTPARVLLYDLLEWRGEDWRDRPLAERRAQLDALFSPLTADAEQSVCVSPVLTLADWSAAAALREQARARGTEGLMLKRRDSVYQVGRRRGDWWKWKIDPLTIDAVLIAAQPGHGRRSTLYTDYTFGLWDGDTLVPVAKAYSGLTDDEILDLDRWIRAHTRGRFGPVRSVDAHHVFELGFEAVNRSSRHKSGIAVRFPRILRWRLDKPAAEADRLDTLRELAR